MTRTTKPLTAFVFALAALPALAQHSSAFTGKVEVGAQGVKDGESPRFQQYQSIEKGADLYEAFLSWRPGSHYWMNLEAKELVTDSRSILVEGGMHGAFKWEMSWNENPNWNSVGQTYYSEASPGVFRLPDALRQQMQATYWTPAAGPIAVTPSDPRNVALGAALGYFTLPAPYTGLNGTQALQNIDLKTQRKTGKVGFAFEGFENWHLGFEYSREERTGNFQTPIYDGTTIAEVAAPIDYKTQNIGIHAQYHDSRFFGQVALEFSNFDDGLNSLSIDNPMRFAFDPARNTTTGAYFQPQAATFAMPTEPDNKASGYHISGGVNLPARHRITVTEAVSVMKMDADLMPGSTVADYLDPTKPLNTVTNLYYQAPNFSTINAKVETSLRSIKVTGSPKSFLGYGLTYRKFEEKDKTPEYRIPFKGRGDSTVPTAQTGLGHHNESWAKNSLKLDVHVTPVRGLRLGFAWGNDKATFENREASEVKDTTATLTLDGQASIGSVRASYTDLKRRPHFEDLRPTFSWSQAGISDAVAGSNQTDQASRNSTIQNFAVTVTPTEDIAATISFNSVENTFLDSQVHGLQASDSTNLGLDLSYALAERMNLVAGYVYETYGFEIASQYLGANSSTARFVDRWKNKTDDQVDTYKVGLRWRILDQLTLQSDFDYSKGRSNSTYLVNAGAAWQARGFNSDPAVTGAAIPYGFNLSNAGPFTALPEVVTGTRIWKTRLGYQFNKSLGVHLLYWVQKYDRADWARDSMMPYMYSVDPSWNKSLVLGARVPSYDAKVIRGSVSYIF